MKLLSLFIVLFLCYQTNSAQQQGTEKKIKIIGEKVNGRPVDIQFANDKIVTYPQGFSVDVSPNGEKLAVSKWAYLGDSTGSVSIFDKEGILLKTLIVLPYSGVKIADDGRFCIYGAIPSPQILKETHVALYDKNGNEILRTNGEEHKQLSAFFSNNGEYFVFYYTKPYSANAVCMDFIIYDKNFKKLKTVTVVDLPIICKNVFKVIASDHKNEIKIYWGLPEDDKNYHFTGNFLIKKTTIIDIANTTYDIIEGWDTKITSAEIFY